MRFPGYLTIFLVITITSSCVQSPGTIPASSRTATPNDAAEAIRKFFLYLNEGEYSEASKLYGGSYEVLRDNNPTLSPDDYQGLLRNACEINGFQCLLVNEILDLERASSMEFLVTLNFLTEDGALFERGPCCGASAKEEPPQSEFQFRVSLNEAGEYHVLDLPVYVP
jgi:hypothetical protein